MLGWLLGLLEMHKMVGIQYLLMSTSRVIVVGSERGGGGGNHGSEGQLWYYPKHPKPPQVQDTKLDN